MKPTLQFRRKSSILEVWLDSKYTLSVELLLDRFGQWNNFRKKNKEKFGEIQQMTPHRPKDLKVQYGMSRINLSWTSLGRQIRTSPGRHIGTSTGCQTRTSPKRQIVTSPGWSNRIFRGRPGTLEGVVLRTSWGPIFPSRFRFIKRRGLF